MVCRRLLLALLVLLWASASDAAITIVQKAGNHNAGGTASVTLMGVTSGCAVIVMAYSFNDLDYTVTDTAGTPVMDVSYFQPDVYVSSVWSVLNTSSGTHTLAIAGGSTNSMIHAWEICGLKTSSAFDVSDTEQILTASHPVATAPTTSQANEIAIALFHSASSGGYTAGSCCGTNFLAITDGDFLRDMSSAALIVSSIGTPAVDVFSGNTLNHDSIVATYKDAVAGSSGPGSSMSMVGVGK